MHHLEHPRRKAPRIPAELRGYIATLCDRQSLVGLLSVDRLWAAEAEKVLYKSVHLFLGSENAQAVLGFVDGLTRSARRTSYIRRLLVDHTGHENGFTHEAVSALGTLLPTLLHLVDLRLLGHDFGFLATMLTAVESPERRFRLHTLYLSQQSNMATPDFFMDVLRAHADSLRVVGINADDARCLWTAAKAHWQDPEDDAQHLDLAEPLRADCVRFAFVRRSGNPVGRFEIFVHAASVSNLATVARSLAADPCGQFSESVTPVETLQMEWDSGPASEAQLHARRRAVLSRAFRAHFPLVKKIELLIRGDIAVIGLDMDAFVETVAQFPLLEALEIMEYRPCSPYHGTIPPCFRTDLMHKLLAAGLEHFRDIKFPDGTRTGVLRPPGIGHVILLHVS